MPLLQSVPVVEQFLLMQLCPGFDQTPLAGGQRSRHHVHGVNADDRHVILPIGVEVRDVMLPARLGEHAHDDSEKPAEFWHV